MPAMLWCSSTTAPSRPRQARLRRAPLPDSSGVPLVPCSAAHCRRICSATAGRTVVSASPCQTETRGQGPLCGEARRTSAAQSAAGRGRPVVMASKASGMLAAAPCGRPAMMAPAAKTSG